MKGQNSNFLTILQIKWFFTLGWSVLRTCSLGRNIVVAYASYFEITTGKHHFRFSISVTI